MRLSKLQQSAYHEAAHAVAFLHVGEPFGFVQVFDYCRRGGDPSAPVGGINYDYRPDEHYSLWRLFVILAGPAADKHMHPSCPWGGISFGGAGKDYKQAWEITEQLGDSGRLVDDLLRTSMMRFVRNEWNSIVKLGDALLSAPERKLSYRECRAVLQIANEVSPTNPESTRA